MQKSGRNSTVRAGHVMTAWRQESRQARLSEQPVETPEAKAERQAALMARIHVADAAAGRKPWNPQPRKRNR